jgi:hypothetical protein
VIFHDGLEAEFMARLADTGHVRFVRLESLHNRSTNDARFYAYRDYLLQQPDIARAFFTDISGPAAIGGGEKDRKGVE